jgi:hypothetical protein
MNQNVQFEERQRFEKQSFEHQNDEQTKNALNQQWNQSRQLAQARYLKLTSVLLLMSFLFYTFQKSFFQKN